MTYVKDLSDIPLKPPQETFVDDPESLDEIFIDDLIFDLQHGLKNINKLHVYHAIFILSKSLQYIIRLQSDPVLFAQFKNQQLAKYKLDLSRNNEYREFTKVSSDSVRSNTPPLSPPLKFAKLSQPPYPITAFKETTPDSLSNEEATPDSLETQEQEQRENEKNDDSSIRDADDNESDENIEGPYIPIEELVDGATFEPVANPITDLDLVKFKQEVLYNQDAKRIEQNQHLLKIFNLVKVPPLSIDQFLLRIKTYSSSISVSAYIHSASMMFKLCILLDIIPLSAMNVYRFILASIRCSTKKLEDVYQKQKSFATVGGVSPKDLYRLEVGFLYLCNFKLVIGEVNLNNYLTDEFLELHKFVKENFEEENLEKDISKEESFES
ncbi:cyclin-domain-containing protein [Scheffersomyces xylosifermentans]|uniref:cyclin-domain-containing protein n=1 Tax=Scheffersomyces xylosifermentans TaxID=1304137 RepID=UPI00315DDBD7